jgi:heme-degrading monooxygenase HmoA
MITVGMNYHIIAGKETEFEAVFAKVIELMRSLDGHVDTHLYRDVHAPSSYVILSEWTEQARFDAFIASPQFRNVADWGKKSILASRPKHEIYAHDATSGAKPRPDGGPRCPAGAN